MSTVLVHFNLDLSIVLACDTSSYGVGMVLAHKMLNGFERPIEFALRTLSQTEKGYSQIKEKYWPLYLELPDFMRI